MTRYTAAHLAEAQRLAPALNSKAHERIAQALCAHESHGRYMLSRQVLAAMLQRDPVDRARALATLCSACKQEATQ
jgi:hypothetical protein